MGVLPELRRSGVGEAMKRFQRGYVRDQRIELITWTFDPLEGVNATLNIAKLRTIARTYQPNLYGTMLDNLNKGIPTDRFEVEWWLNHPRVTDPVPAAPDPDRLQTASGALLVNPAVHGAAPVPLPGAVAAGLSLETNADAPSAIPASGSISTIEVGQLPDTLVSTPRPAGSTSDSVALSGLPTMLLVEVPASYQSVKQYAMDLARSWRMHTRQIFEALFSAGYVVVDFVSKPDLSDGPRRNYYILQKEPPIPDV
jgi:predicted GNAT superfamily acetyltransferase